MTTFEDLKQAFKSSPEEMFKQIDALDAKARHKLLVENVEGRLQDNRVEDEDSVTALPREYRRQAGVRWDHFGYVLHYFDRPMLEHQLRGHLEIETEDSKATYMRNMLATLAWMSINHDSEDADSEVTPVKKRRRG